MTVAILNVNPHTLSTDTVKSLLAEDRYDFIERRSHVNINHARNQLVYDFLLTGYDHALLLDSDVVFPKGAIAQLLQSATEWRTIITALYGQPIKDIPLITHPDGTPWPDYPENQLVPSGPTGVGFMLVNRQVFIDIQMKARSKEFPWFREATENHMWVSEDIFFCRRAIEAGHLIVTDTSLIVGHQKNGQVYYPHRYDYDAVGT